jgi:phosphopantothenoylcysteine decarboxylase/phosphopantothenate--cysteine ligase
LVVGFAAETENVVAHAREKLEQKGLDLIVANHVGDTPYGFESDENELILVDAKNVTELPPATKSQLARDLVGYIADKVRAHRRKGIATPAELLRNDRS